MLLSTVSISIGNADVLQSSAGSVATFHVTLSQSPSPGQPITVNYATVLGGTATASDFPVPPAKLRGALTFTAGTPGATDQTITIPIVGSTTPAQDKTFLVNLLSPTSFTLANGDIVHIVDNMGLGTIVNDNPAVYMPTGPFDATFGQNGVVQQKGTTSRGNAVAVDSNDRPVIAGGVAGIGGYLAVARYNPNGSLDTTFNGTGLLTDNDNGPAGGVAVYQSGPNRDKILVVANSTFPGPDFSIVRYNVDGSLDDTFGFGGVVFPVFLEGSPFGGKDKIQVNGISIYQDPSSPDFGKLLVVGTANDQELMVARFNANGSPDTSFNATSKTPGVVFLTPPGAAAAAGNAVTLTSLAQGELILVAGSETDLPGATGILLAQFNHDGTLSKAFGSNGVAIAPTPPADSDQANAVALDGSGNIVVAGSGGPGGTDALLARFTPGGTLDPTFNGTGLELGLPLPGALAEVYQAVLVTADGQIVAAGATENEGLNEAFVVRDNPDGSPDSSFDPAQSAGVPGVLVVPASPGNANAAAGLALDSQGNILVGGSTGDVKARSFLLARIDPDRANLVITATASPEPVAPGQQLVYTVTVINTGDPAAYVSLSSSLPALTTSATLLSAPAGWLIDPAFSSGSSLIALDRVLTKADGPQTFTIAVTVAPTAVLNSHLVAVFTANSGTLEQDPPPEERSATVTSTVQMAVQSIPVTPTTPVDPGPAPPIATIPIVPPGPTIPLGGPVIAGPAVVTSFVAIFLPVRTSAVEALFAVGGGDLVAAVLDSLTTSVILPGALQGRPAESMSASSLDGMLGPGESVGGLVARNQEVEGVPDNPVVQLAVAPVEVNVLKVISSLNDGGTNVLHFEQLVLDRGGVKEAVAGEQPALTEPSPGAPLSIPTPSADPPASHSPPVQGRVWWFVGGAALFGCAAFLVRYLVPRWLYRSQTA